MQPDLFTMARTSDIETSHLAAQDAAGKARSNRRRALEVLGYLGAEGATDFELADLTGLQQTSVGKRRGELRDMGLVAARYVHTAEGRVAVRRRTPSGSLAQVWTVTLAGLELLNAGGTP